MNLLDVILPEIILVIAACGLFLLGISTKASGRRLAAWAALLALLVVIVIQASTLFGETNASVVAMGGNGVLAVGPLANFIKLLTGIIGVLLLLLAWPTNRDATGSASLNFGREAGEFYGLMLLSFSGLMLVADANDLMLLFLGIELASIPTYIMVSMSRPLPMAQEAGVKYFFLGAMAAAVMLFGFSYLYGVTGLTHLNDIRAFFNPQASAAIERPHVFTQWEVLAVCVLLAGFAFKIAAVPLHAYVGDVYQGAATPVTALLAFVPKTSGFIAILKILMAVGGADWKVPPEVVTLLWALAALTMSVGNMLGLLQQNVKRVFAYSSVAHTGYMLVGVTALVAAGNSSLDATTRDIVQRHALSGVLFYLAAYGVMNIGAFGVLMLLPGRGAAFGAPPVDPAAPTAAETFEDIAGIGRKHVLLGLAMAVCCFSLIGMPFTVGFYGKLYLVMPALRVGTRQMNWLTAILALNAAVGAVYYLRIVATMFLRAESTDPGAGQPADAVLPTGRMGWLSPVTISIAISIVLTLGLGIIFPATDRVFDSAFEAAQMPPADSTALPLTHFAATTDVR